MAFIDEIILRSTNPFDTFRSVNFWHKQQQLEPTVDSIHLDALAAIEATLAQIVRDHRTQTVLLDGDGGSGKIYLLDRLKKALNHKFVARRSPRHKFMSKLKDTYKQAGIYNADIFLEYYMTLLIQNYRK